MKRITLTQKISFITTLLFIFVSFGYVLFYKHIYEMRRELVKMQAEERVAKSFMENMLATELLLAETKEKREMLLHYFISANDPTIFLETLESTAKEVGAILEVSSLAEISDDLKNGEDNQDKKIATKQVKATLLIEGTWESVYSFLYLIESMPFAATVTHITFSEDAKEKGVWSGQLYLEYRIK